MNLNEMTTKLQEAIVMAKSIAENHQHQQIEHEHLFLALLQQHEGLTERIILYMKEDAQQLKNKVIELLALKPEVSGSTQEAYISTALQTVFKQAKEYEQEWEDEYLSVEHVLLALLKTAASTHHFQKLLQMYQLTETRVYQAIKEIRGNQRVTSKEPESTYEALKNMVETW